jgi:hypothetical protein
MSGFGNKQTEASIRPDVWYVSLLKEKKNRVEAARGFYERGY